MVLQLPNSLLLKATVQSKSKQFFLNLLLQKHFVGKKPAARVKKRPAAVLEADKPPASEAASVHSKEGSGSGEEKTTDHPEPAGAVTPVDMGYSIMTYASTGAVAIKEKKAWEETAVSNSKSQKIPCPTQRPFGESKAKTSER